MPANNNLQVTVKNRQGIIFQSIAVSFTSVNDTGVFDVLPGHANFISLVQDYVEVILDNGEVNRIEITPGVMKVENNAVNVYLGVKAT